MVTARWSRSPTRSRSPSPGQGGSSSAPGTATTTAAPTYVPGWSRHSSASATLPNRRPRRTAPGPNQRSLERWRPVDLVPAEQPFPSGPPERLVRGGAQPLFVRAHRVPDLLDTMNRHEVHRHASRPHPTRSPPTGAGPIADASRARNADPVAACTSPAATAILAPTDPRRCSAGSLSVIRLAVPGQRSALSRPGALVLECDRLARRGVSAAGSVASRPKTSTMRT